MYQKILGKAATVILAVALSLNSNIPMNTTEYDVVELLKEEVHETQNWDKDCEDNTIQLTQYEAYLLMAIASTEALNQGTDGMLLIMESIMNRVNSPKFPNTVYSVISQKGQFTSFTSGAYLHAQITPEVHMALAKLEMNKNPDTNVVAFESAKCSGSLLTYFDFYEVFKDHVFYKIKD